MFIRNWNPEVKVERTYLSDSRISPHLYLRVLLGCPVCDAGQLADCVIELDPWNVKYLKNLEYLVNSACSEKHCTSCGVSSIVPPTGKKALKEAVEALVTTEWLTECVEELGAKVGKKSVRTVHDTVEEMESYETNKSAKGRSIKLEPAMLLPGVEPAPI